MHELIKPNQSAFIQGRRIHENFMVVQLSCRWLHAHCWPSMLLKIDLAKAFDSVAWPFLLELLQHVGFPLRWHEWVGGMLSTASTKVLVNGRPRDRIRHARSLRQGDPLSPLLFVIVMEVLNALITGADRRGVFSSLPAKIMNCASIYADDLVIFLAPTSRTSPTSNASWTCSWGASSLITNVDKCAITPIHCSKAQVTAVHEVFPCKLQEFPTKYLGAPLSISRISRSRSSTLSMLSRHVSRHGRQVC